MPDAPIPEAKARLREMARARRSALPADRRAALSADVTTRLVEFLASRPVCAVSAFLSIGDELDTEPTITGLVAAGHRVALPVMQGRAKPLLFRLYRPGDALGTVQWGIREPLATAQPQEPDVLLVPLLAFDLEGHRLGYGGGYYDRTLAALRQRRSVIAIGLAFDEQEVDAVPHLDYDERLDWVVTPTRQIRTRS